MKDMNEVEQRIGMNMRRIGIRLERSVCRKSARMFVIKVAVMQRVQARHLAMIWISEKEELNVVLEAVERHEHQR
jgi:hypothetical protein